MKSLPKPLTDDFTTKEKHKNNLQLVITWQRSVSQTLLSHVWEPKATDNRGAAFPNLCLGGDVCVGTLGDVDHGLISLEKTQ